MQVFCGHLLQFYFTKNVEKYGKIYTYRNEKTINKFI